MIPYGKQWIDDDDIHSVLDILNHDFITQGPMINQFEKKFAEKVGSKYAVAVSNGTAALHLANLAANLKSGENGITTPMTFAASANCIRYCGSTVKFADIYSNGLVNPKEIEKNIDQKSKVIIPVDYSGISTEIDQIKEIADKHNLIIIQDSCHSLGGKYKNSTIGDCKYSDMTVFSFHPVKHITTGEGGMITTNSKEFYEKLSLLRTHGITKEDSRFLNTNEGGWYYEMQFLGYNYRLTDIQAALGISQLNKLDKFVKRRREIAEIYQREFNQNPNFSYIHEPSGVFASYHLFPILLNDRLKKLRKDVFNELRKNNIGVQILYIPVYYHPYYQNLGYKKGICPIAEDFYDRVICLPMYPKMDENDINNVIENVYLSLKKF